MKKIIIISDTHADTIDKLPVKVIDDIREADIVFHAGDSDTLNFIDELEDICKCLYAVKGNCDLGSKLPEKIVTDIEGVKIAISHGTGNYNNIADRLYYMFSDENPDIIIHGHNHIPISQDIEGIWFINPGSTRFNRTLNYGTYAKLIIDNGKFTAEIEATE